MRKRKGQAVLETAIVLPIFLLFFCGIIDFGRVLQASSQLNMITQEAARLASLGRSYNDINQFTLNNTTLPDKGTLIVSVNPPDYKPGNYVTVKITYDVKYITPLIGRILPSPFKVNTSSTIRVE